MRDHPDGHYGRPETKYAQKASLGAFARLLIGTRPSLAGLAAALTLSILSTLGGLLVPLFMKSVVNGLATASFPPGKVALIILAFLVQAGGSALAGYLLARIAQTVISRVRERLWRKQLRLRVRRFDESGSGELVSRMANDTMVLKSFITDNMVGFVSGTISAMGALAFLISIDWKMSLVLLAAIPIGIGLLVPLGRTMRKVGFRTMDENAGLVATLSRALSEIRLVKSSNAEGMEFERGRKSIESLYSVGVREGLVTALISPAMSLVLMALLVVIVGFGGARVASGTLSSGDLVAFILYLIQVVMPATMLVQSINQLEKARGATQSIIGLLAEAEEADSGRTIRRAAGKLSFEGVRFSYKEDEPLFEDLTFDAEAGKVTALVGPSGSGKTSVFSLVERFYEPEAGLILIGDEPITDISLASWRSRIGYVLQDSPMLAGTIRDNLVYGLTRPVDEEELRVAAWMANAAEFIEALPDGYDTEVGERGVKLSGGQRQRIAIARAFLRDPDILMLDEATSSLDSESEAMIRDGLRRLRAGRTTFVIAHRLSTIETADLILVVEGGEIVERGAHAELMALGGRYRQLHDRQQSSELDQFINPGEDFTVPGVAGA